MFNLFKKNEDPEQVGSKVINDLVNAYIFADYLELPNAKSDIGFLIRIIFCLYVKVNKWDHTEFKEFINKFENNFNRKDIYIINLLNIDFDEANKFLTDIRDKIEIKYNEHDNNVRNRVILLESMMKEIFSSKLVTYQFNAIRTFMHHNKDILTHFLEDESINELLSQN